MRSNHIARFFFQQENKKKNIDCLDEWLRKEKEDQLIILRVILHSIPLEVVEAGIINVDAKVGGAVAVAGLGDEVIDCFLT